MFTASLAVATATVVGVMIGVEFCVSVFINPILLRLPAATTLTVSPHFGRILGRIMPFWYIASLILTVGLAAATWGSAAAGSAVTASILLAVSVVLSVALLVPIANRSKTWTAEDHPDDWREQLKRWDRLHYARVALIVAAFVFTLVALTAR